MTDSFREQRPLLCDECSDEEFQVKSYNYQRRSNRPSIRSGRARNYAKGAANVITRWPDNCSTSVAYWWLGVSMIAITVFVIYNIVLIFGMIPKSDMKIPKYRTYNSEIKPKTQILTVPDVYLHLIVNNDSDILLTKYLYYTTVLSKKYPDFKYNFIVVLNDTSNNLFDFNDAERNDIAFNSLWRKENLNKKIYTKNNISVEHISLTTYLNDSPIKKFWRHLPTHLIEFLVRPISIWEKGGIALNPKIIIPNISNRKYIEKIYEIFNSYKKSSSKPSESKITASFYDGISTKRPNNIRDIINALDKEDSNIANIDLSGVENNIVVVTKTHKFSKIKRDLKNNNNTDNNNVNYKDSNESPHKTDNNSKETNYFISNITNYNNKTKTKLPLLLKYIFENNPKGDIPNILNLKNREITKNGTSLINIASKNTMIPKKSNKEEPAATGENITLLDHNKYDNAPELCIDIKGNIIATKTGCHAFLGTMFSNVIQYSEKETVTDFIISELSLFCNGLLTLCTGINVILV